MPVCRASAGATFSHRLQSVVSGTPCYPPGAGFSRASRSKDSSKFWHPNTAAPFQPGVVAHPWLLGPRLRREDWSYVEEYESMKRRGAERQTGKEAERRKKRSPNEICAYGDEAESRLDASRLEEYKTFSSLKRNGQEGKKAYPALIILRRASKGRTAKREGEEHYGQTEQDYAS